MMKKTLLAVAVITGILAGVGYMKSDEIHQIYLQKQVDINLVVHDGVISYYGFKAADGETPKQLIERVKESVNGQDILARIMDKRFESFADTEEVKALDKIRDQWGWESDKELEDDIKRYAGKSYLKDFYEKALSKKEFRNNSGYDIQQVKAKMAKLREDIINNNIDSYESFIDAELNLAYTITGDEGYKQAKPILMMEILSSISGDKPKEIAGLPFEELEKMLMANMKVSIENSKEDIAKFTDEFRKIALVKAISVEDITTGFEYEDDGFSAKYNVTSVVQSGLVKKTVISSCSAYGNPYPAVMGSAVMLRCGIKVDGKSYDKSVDLYDFEAKPYVATDYANEKHWGKIKSLIINEYL